MQRDTHQPAVIVDTRHSPFCRLRPLSLTDVHLNDTFWQPRREINRTVTLPSQYQRCEATGCLDNFRRAAGLSRGTFQGRVYNDSDVYKWLEAVAWTLATDPDPKLLSWANETIALIAAAQDDTGYLNTYFTFERAAERWTNLQVMHELYCAGHLIQAAVAYHRATGLRTLLDVAMRLADHIAETFGPTARPGTSGHPEIEMALVELARETGEQRYLQEAQFFIDQRGRRPSALGGLESTVEADLRHQEYAQDHAPVREQHAVVGHAVRALYLYAGVTGIYAETGEQALERTLEALWHNLEERKVYITGGVGARYEWEALGEDYELPNKRAYAETCAAIAHVMWNWRLLLVKGEARFTDALETALYNAVLSGVSLDGQAYFYQNPLADDGSHRRQPWFNCACCPTNIARFLASLPGYCYATSDEGLWVHLYASSTATTVLPNGQRVTVQQHTDYPWDGEIELELHLSRPTLFSLFVRIPGWVANVTVQINGEILATPVVPGSYVEIRRQWNAGDSVHLSLPMPVRLIASHPRVESNHDRVALMRGPLVYCVEQVDHPDVDIWSLVLPARTDWEVIRKPDMLGGVVVARTEALAISGNTWSGKLYQLYDDLQPEYKPVQLTAIPYYAWANREPGAMQVWLPIENRVHHGKK